MTDWYYYNTSGERMGPVGDDEITQLIEQGTVSPQMKIEYNEGRPACFYYDENGERIGPIRGGKLQKLAREGTITPETRIEQSGKGITSARQVNGLPFSETVQPESNIAENTEEQQDSGLIQPPPSKLSKPWFYYNGKDRIPMLGNASQIQQELQRLADQRIITQQTLVESSNGQMVTAGEVKGLTFPDLASQSFSVSEPTTEPKNPFTNNFPKTDNPFIRK